MKDTDLFVCRLQPAIAMPAEIDLIGDMLHWRGGMSFGVERPTAGCLDDFVKLADANSEEVLRFTQTRGVLGIEPLVYINEEDNSETWDYQEPVFVYRELAGRFASVLRVMKSLKQGEPPRKKDVEGCCPEGWKPVLHQRATAETYFLMQAVVSSYWQTASVQMRLPGFGSDSSGLRLVNRSDILLWFGGWADGHTRDHQREKLTRDQGMIAPLTQVQHELISQDEHFVQLLISRGYRLSAEGEWIVSYQDYAREWLGYYHYKGRPSALYNLLAFQLLGRVALEEDEFPCSQCKRLYTYDAEKRQKPKDALAARDTKAWGNSKPRSDRPTAFCCQGCRTDYDAADKCRRRHGQKTSQEELNETLAYISRLAEGMRQLTQPKVAAQPVEESY